MSQSGKFLLRQTHKQTTRDLNTLNREMALKMIMLACDTGDTEPLIEAVLALRKTEDLFNSHTTPIENAHIQKKLGDVLLSIGTNEVDMRALEHAILAYRSAITISSLLGEMDFREDVRKKYKLALKCAGQDDGQPTVSLMGAA
ncbi:MAG: hypothetical protein COA69_01645 [Robiginitomaculum sp.]|nr:MAG: hypothetical protein COA69_01645 [Robiginitomaculum sp.]